MGSPKILSTPWPFIKSRFHCSLLFSIKFVLKYDYEFLTCILKNMTLRGKKVVSASQDAISRQNYLKLHLGCHSCWLSYFTLVCLWCGRTVNRAYGHVITKISRMGRLPNFVTDGAPLRARGVPLIITINNYYYCCCCCQ